jgi:hypothetical protein
MRERAKLREGVADRHPRRQMVACALHEHISPAGCAKRGNPKPGALQARRRLTYFSEQGAVGRW